MVVSEIDTGEFLDVNDSWVRMLGYAREEQIGRTSKELGIWRDPGTRERIIAKLKEKGSFRNERIRFRTKTGGERHVLWSGEVVVLGGRPVLLSPAPGRDQPTAGGDVADGSDPVPSCSSSLPLSWPFWCLSSGCWRCCGNASLREWRFGNPATSCRRCSTPFRSVCSGRTPSLGSWAANRLCAQDAGQELGRRNGGADGRRADLARPRPPRARARTRR